MARRWYNVHSSCTHAPLLSFVLLMAMPIPLVGFYRPRLPANFSLSCPLWCLLGSFCSILLFYLSLVRICVACEGSRREVPSGTRIEQPWPSGTLPPSPPRIAPRLHPQFNPHQTKSAFHLCPRHGIAASNGLISKGTLSASLLYCSLTWPQPCSQCWHIPPIHHPSLLRHPHLQPLCLPWKIVTSTQNNSNWRCPITKWGSNKNVFRPWASGIQFQFSKTWSSRSGGMLMTFSLE